MISRIISAAVLAPLLWLAIKVAPAWVFIAAALALIPVACWELYRMLIVSGGQPFVVGGLAGCVGVVWAFTGIEPTFEHELPMVVAMVLVVLAALWRRDDPRAMFTTSRDTLFPILFVALPLGFLVGLRRVPGTDGPDLVLMLFLCLILGDTFAFFVGSRFGKRRLAPRLSPNKSWEGAVGGIAGSVLAAVLAHVWFWQRLPLGHALALGVILGTAGILGDLAESMLKRASGVKDSSNLIPGHGGLLDRTDSLLFAAPLLYYYYQGFLTAAP